MSFEDDFDFGDDLEEEESVLPEESGNRMFLIVAGVLGGIALLALICIAVYALVFLPQRETPDVDAINAQNTEVAMIIQQTEEAHAATAEAAAWTPTPTETPIPPPASPTPSPTLVVAGPSTATPTVHPYTATAMALQITLTANAILLEQTKTAQPALLTPEAIPDTGFADDIGLPVMLGAALLLVVVIFFARKLRTT